MPLQFVQKLDNFIKEMQLLDAGKVEEKGEGGEMDDDINQNINNVDDKDYTEVIVTLCLVFYQKIQIVGNKVLQ